MVYLFALLCLPLCSVHAMELPTALPKTAVVSTVSTNNNAAGATLTFEDNQQLNVNQSDLDLLCKKSTLIAGLVEDIHGVQTIPLACKKDEFELILKLLRGGIRKQILAEKEVDDTQLPTIIRLADFLGIDIPFRYISEEALLNASQEDRHRYLEAWRGYECKDHPKRELLHNMSYQDMYFFLCGEWYFFCRREQGFLKLFASCKSDVESVKLLKAKRDSYVRRCLNFGIVSGLSLLSVFTGFSQRGHQRAATIATTLSCTIIGYMSVVFLKKYLRKKIRIETLQSSIDRRLAPFNT